jgi:hypothetical protein
MGAKDKERAMSQILSTATAISTSYRQDSLCGNAVCLNKRDNRDHLGTRLTNVCVREAGSIIQRTPRHVVAFFQKLPPCLIGIEACASWHYWSLELQSLGHSVRLMWPAYVTLYVSGTKTTPLMPRQSVRRLLGRTCGSSRPRRRATELPNAASYP